MSKHILEAKVSDALAKIRPFLIADEGDIVLEEVTSERIAKIKLVGACKTCPVSEMTFQGGVRETVLQNVPEIKDIIAV